jgi:hypothetical protein
VKSDEGATTQLAEVTDVTMLTSPTTPRMNAPPPLPPRRISSTA